MEEIRNNSDIARPDDIAIIGVGCILPDALDTKTFW